MSSILPVKQQLGPPADAAARIHLRRVRVSAVEPGFILLLAEVKSRLAPEQPAAHARKMV